MRTYEQTHPWIKFQIDLRSASPDFWMLLGEASSKCEHISSVPLQPKTAAYLHQLYLAKGALATTAIEGNTLSEAEVVKHLEGKLRLPPSKQYLASCEFGARARAGNGLARDTASKNQVTRRKSAAP